MCGRFTLFFDEDNFMKEFAVEELPLFPPRYNIAPNQTIPIVIHNMERRKNLVQLSSWGFVPHWVKDLTIAPRSINARGETLVEKPYFRKAFQHHRCLIPANGFYEWDKRSKPSTPLRYCLDNDRLFAFAGIFSYWHNEDSSVNIVSSAIITTEANNLVKPIHDRMPVILLKDEYNVWLDQEIDTTQLMPYLRTREIPGLQQYPVSPYVNNARQDDIRCLERIN